MTQKMPEKSPSYDSMSQLPIQHGTPCLFKTKICRGENVGHIYNYRVTISAHGVDLSAMRKI